MKNLSDRNKIIGVILLVLLLDQWLKIWVKTSFTLGEDVQIASWFHLHFIENNGMAFGMEVISKTFLSVFRIVAVAAIGYFIHYLLKNKFQLGFIVCVALIFAGALGNIIDCVFYGLIFDISTPVSTATLFPEAGGYGTILNGKVVDMLYFPLFGGTFPDWFPFCAGEDWEFFSPIFNLADASICVGVGYVIVFYNKILKQF